MAIGKSIRIYDLAREVKQDTKRVMEDLRREGADISVASNSVSHAIAEKVRSKYFPKTEIAPKRAIKVIKAAARPAEEVPVLAEPEIPQAEAPVEVLAPIKKAVPKEVQVQTVEAPEVASASKVKKLAAKPRPEAVPEPESLESVVEAAPKIEEPVLPEVTEQPLGEVPT